MQATIPGIPTAEEEQKASFKLDTEKTFARLVITPICAISDDGEARFIQVEEAIEIRPYPDPWTFGGLWGHGWLKPEEEEKVLADFHHWADPWIERGLTRVDIIRQPEETHHVPTEAQREEARKRYATQCRYRPSRDERESDQRRLF